MAQSQFKGLKNLEMTPDKGEDVTKSSWLNGLAKDSSVMDETNRTEQMKTGKQPLDDLGGKNNLNG